MINVVTRHSTWGIADETKTIGCASVYRVTGSPPNTLNQYTKAMNEELEKALSKVKNNRLFISFSGGKTSAYMTKLLLDYYNTQPVGVQIVVLFANTGAEHDKTLEFIHKCDQQFGFMTTWIEAVVHHGERVGSTHKVVTHETAARSGELYEDSVKKYGTFNPANPSCTQKVKINPMTSFLRLIGWEKGSYSTAIGIRADEIDRISQFARLEFGAIYPLADMGITNHDVIEWWDSQSFNLEIDDLGGGCGDSCEIFSDTND